MPLHRVTAQEMVDYKFFPKKNYCYKEISNSFVQKLNRPPRKQISKQRFVDKISDMAFNIGLCNSSFSNNNILNFRLCTL